MDKNQIEKLQKYANQVAKLEKTINEIAADWVVSCDYECDKCPWGSCRGKIAAFIIKAGYRKIPEGSVVLTKEEHEKLKSLANNHCKYCHLMDLPDFETEKIVRDTTRKETAEKFAERLKAKLTDIISFEDYEVADWNYDGMDIENSIDEICKEITEGKV